MRFGLALNDGKLLRPESVAEMYRPQLDSSVRSFTRDGEPEPLAHRQALAWSLRTDPTGREFPSHTGTVKGTRSFIGDYPEQGLVVALQANALPLDSARYGIAIAQMLLPAADGADGTDGR